MFQEFLMIILVSVEIIGDLFLVEVSDGLPYSLGSRQGAKLYPARVLTGTRVFRSLYAFRVPNYHLNKCTK